MKQKKLAIGILEYCRLLEYGHLGSELNVKPVKSFIPTLVLCAILINNAFAQEKEDDNSLLAEPAQAPEHNGFAGSIGLSYVALDKEAAASEKIGESAFSLDLIGSYYFSPHLITSLGLGLISLDDKDQFSQTVVSSGLFGSDTETATSEASAIQFYTEAHYLTSPVSPLALQFRAGAGYGAIAYADRSIDRCADCRKEDIDLNGGAYVTGGLFRESAADQFNFGFSVRKYFSSDINATAMLWLEYVM